MAEPETGRMAYSIREVAHALGISEAAVYKMVQRGKLAHVQVGGRKFIPASLMRILTAGK